MAVPAQVSITQGNTQDIKVYGLQDIDTLQFWNAASASANLIDQSGNPTMVQGVILNYVADSLGNYSGEITTDYTLLVGGGYTLIIDASEGGAVFHIEIPARVIVRVN